mmetsp:Transcript_41538/g.96030  ORF Transcript_41538/g.96030 Transcript_41538/m.96030 type:complete len:213 (-) Transcript_41538:1554-2192(-)
MSWSAANFRTYCNCFSSSSRPKTSQRRAAVPLVAVRCLGKYARRSAPSTSRSPTCRSPTNSSLMSGPPTMYGLQRSRRVSSDPISIGHFGADVRPSPSTKRESLASAASYEECVPSCERHCSLYTSTKEGGVGSDAIQARAVRYVSNAALKSSTCIKARAPTASPPRASSLAWFAACAEMVAVRQITMWRSFAMRLVATGNSRRASLSTATI